MNKKVAIIGTVGVPAKYGGFETLTEYLAQYLCDDFDITVFCSAKHYDEKPATYNGVSLSYINLNANGIESIPYDIISILKALKFADTILILGVSGCIVLPFVKLFSSKKIIVNIDGLEWKRAKWSKGAKWFLKYSEKLAVKYTDEVVTDNKVIQEYVEFEYRRKSRLIAYGADHVVKESMSNTLKNKYPFLHNRYAFKVCRIEPENNVHLILEAFKVFKKLNIVIIGNWKNSDYGKNLKLKYIDSKNIFLVDPVYDQQVLNRIRSNCYIYIHGHSAGGTNPSLVEAMYLELPILSYRAEYNRETTQGKALYFGNTENIVTLLECLDDEKLAHVARDMKIVAEKNYTWKKISNQYSKLF